MASIAAEGKKRKTRKKWKTRRKGTRGEPKEQGKQGNKEQGKDRVGWGYSDLGQFGSLFDKLSFFHYINSEKVDSIRVNNNFMELVPNHHTEMVLQQLQQLQHQLKFGYFE